MYHSLWHYYQCRISRTFGGCFFIELSAENNLSSNQNMANDNNKIVIVMSTEEYNSIVETLHIISSWTNQKRLDEAIDEMLSGKSIKHKLIEA